MNTAKLTSLFAILSCLAAGMPLAVTGCSSESSDGGDGEDQDQDDDDDDDDQGEDQDDDDQGEDQDQDEDGCSGDEQQCDGLDLLVCESDQFETLSCDAACEQAHGFSSNSCADDSCQCDGDPTNSRCVDGVSAFCACAEWAGSSCAEADYGTYYAACHDGSSPEIGCFASYVSGNEVDCGGAVDGCL